MPRKPTTTCALIVAVRALTAMASDCQIQNLADPESNTVELGRSVAISGETLAVGVPIDPDMPALGAVYLFARVNGRWARQTVVSDGPVEPPYGFFAASVALQRGTLVVGAPSTMNDPEIDGAVYIFERDATGDWGQSARLLGDAFDADPPLSEGFGEAVALDGDTLVVGAPRDDDNGYQSGTAYVFQRQTDRSWLRTNKLLADDGYGGDHFGASVAIYGDVIIVGAPEDDDFGFASGAAYVFERQPDGAWTQTRKLLPSVGHGLQLFGYSVAAGDNLILIGAVGDNTAAPNAGAVYVYERDPDLGWIESQRLLAQNPGNSDYFGASMAMVGELAVVGAENYDQPFFRCGAAFVYHRQADGFWRLSGTLTAHDAQEGARFGRSLALSGNLALVGAPHHDGVDEYGQPIEDAGAAYVFAVGPDADADGTMDVCECLAAGDLDLSGAIELQDLVFLLSSFGAGPGGDVNGDGQTDLSDLATLLAHFGETCP